MKTLTIKIIIYTILFLVIQIGFFPTIKVLAHYSDIENGGYLLTAGSLDFVLAGDSFNEGNIQAPVTKEIEIISEGSLDFQYTVFPEFGTQTLLCGDLTLNAKLNGIEIYNGNLNDFYSLATTTLGVWSFTLTPRENSFGICEFNLVYQGWRQEFSSYSDGGFRDEEVAGNFVEAIEPLSPPPSESCIVINEVYYYPGTRENNGGFENNPNDEWIELYNTCDYEVNIKNWYLENEDDSEIINQNYIIDSHQFVVIAANASTWTYWPDIPDNAFKIALGGTKMFGDGLDDNGDVVMLYDDENNLIDSVSWGDNITAFFPSVVSVVEGHSISRKEKGVDTDTADDWMDTSDGSTPPGPNPGTNPHNLEGGLISPFLTESIIEDSEEDTADSESEDIEEEFVEEYEEPLKKENKQEEDEEIIEEEKDDEIIESIPEAKPEDKTEIEVIEGEDENPDDENIPADLPKEDLDIVEEQEEDSDSPESKPEDETTVEDEVNTNENNN